MGNYIISLIIEYYIKLLYNRSNAAVHTHHSKKHKHRSKSETSGDDENQLVKLSNEI